MKLFEFCIISIGIVLLVKSWFFINRDGMTIDKNPSVLIVCLIRNKAHTLPLFLTYLHEQTYPKNRISLWIKTDHNEDNSRTILETWLNQVEKLYHSIHYHFDEGETMRSDENQQKHWSQGRFHDVIDMKEEAFDYARKSNFDFVFFVDADVILTFSSTLEKLVNLNLPIVAPMLVSEGLFYSNFWCGMTASYGYIRTEDYLQINEFGIRGEFNVPIVHTAVLIDIRNGMNEFLTFNKTKLNSFYKRTKYNGPESDVITFAISALFSSSCMTISNSHHYGFIPSPLEESDEKTIMTYTRMAIINMYGKVNILPYLQKFVLPYPKKSSLTFDEIYMINLKRRPERRMRKEAVFRELGINCTFIEAVDGRELTEQTLIEKGITLFPNFKDWYSGRFLTMGEVGCFLSHYKIWEKIVREQQQEVLIFEDDVNFKYKFNSEIMSAMEEARQIGGFDLIYIDRYPRARSLENFLPESKKFIKVAYSFMANAYVLTLKGAEKLLAAEPLKKLLPTDHFLPIMYDSYDNYEWMGYFKKRDLVAWSLAKLLAYPSYYIGDENHTSDTRKDGSRIVQKDILEVGISQGNKEL